MRVKIAALFFVSTLVTVLTVAAIETEKDFFIELDSFAALLLLIAVGSIFVEGESK